MTGVLIQGGEDRETHRGKMEADSVVVCLLAKVCSQPQEVGRVQEGLVPRISRGMITLRHFDFELLASYICERINFYFPSYLVCGILSWQPWK